MHQDTNTTAIRIARSVSATNQTTNTGASDLMPAVTKFLQEENSTATVPSMALRVSSVAETSDNAEIRDFDLANGLLEIMTGYTVAEIVNVARCGDLSDLPQVTRATTKRIMELLKASGHLSQELIQSKAIQQLLVKVDPMFDNNDSQSAPPKIFTAKQIDWVVNDLLCVLKPNESKILMLRFGLKGEAPLTHRACGSILRLSGARVQQIETKAIEKLRDSVRKDRIIEHFPELRQLKDFNLSVRPFAILSRAGITNVGQLCQMTESQLLDRCENLGRKSLEEISEKLKKLNLRFAAEPNKE